MLAWSSDKVDSFYCIVKNILSPDSEAFQQRRRDNATNIWLDDL